MCPDISVGAYRGEWECYWAGSWVAQVGKLGRVRLVASYKKEDRSDNPKFFTASKLTWERKHILQRRRRRWTVETSYEDVKGPLGFDEYEARDHRSYQASLVSGLLRLLRIACRNSSWAFREMGQ